MGLFSKITTNGAAAVKTLVTRSSGGFECLGAHTKPTDTRTAEQLLTNIEIYAKRNPEVKRFEKELKNMNPRHLSLVSDVCELANRRELLNTNINLKEKGFFANLISQLPFASKENPAALDFAQEVLNQTDAKASKYFLASVSGGVLKDKSLAGQFQAAKPLVKDFAESTLSGGYTSDFSKEESFMKFIKVLVNPKSDPKKIEIFDDVCKIADFRPAEYQIDIDNFVQSSVPVEKIKANMKTFPVVAHMAEKEGKSINIVDFLNNNVNLY